MLKAEGRHDELQKYDGVGSAQPEMSGEKSVACLTLGNFEEKSGRKSDWTSTSVAHVNGFLLFRPYHLEDVPDASFEPFTDSQR
jgi:hypothetical protein